LLILRHDKRCFRTGGSSRKRAAGFSLIELILILVILTTMTLLVGAGTFHTSMIHQRLKCAARKVQADLAMVRQRALASSEEIKVQFDVTENGYTLLDIPDPDSPGRSDTDVEFNKYPYEIKLVSVDINGGGEVVYDPFGRPDHGGTIVLEYADVTVTVAIDPETGLATFD
jgi:hypothetical protein